MLEFTSLFHYLGKFCILFRQFLPKSFFPQVFYAFIAEKGHTTEISLDRPFLACFIS